MSRDTELEALAKEMLAEHPKKTVLRKLIGQRIMDILSSPSPGTLHGELRKAAQEVLDLLQGQRRRIGTWRGVQAITRLSEVLASHPAPDMDSIMKDNGHPDEGPCVVCGAIFDTHAEGCVFDKPAPASWVCDKCGKVLGVDSHAAVICDGKYVHTAPATRIEQEQRILEVLQEMLARGGLNVMDWACGRLLALIDGGGLREALEKMVSFYKEANEEIPSWKIFLRLEQMLGDPALARTPPQKQIPAKDIPIPPGWKKVREGLPSIGEHFISDNGNVGYQDSFVNFDGRDAIRSIVEPLTTALPQKQQGDAP